MSVEGAIPSPHAYYGQVPYDRYLETHPGYRARNGDVLIFLIGRFPLEFMASKKEQTRKASFNPVANFMNL